jgi:hypothetical protein
MGRLILKSHYVGNVYYQDGYFGVKPTEGELVIPIDDRAEIANFCELFELERANEPGLSLVVPYPDPELTENSLIDAVLRDYFYPILVGSLEVWIETPTVKTVLDKNSLLNEAKKLGNAVSADLRSLLGLANWARQVPSDEKLTFNMPEPSQAWKWSDSLVSAEQRAQLSSKYQAGENIAVRIPVTIRKKGERPRESYFELFLARDESENSGRPTFIREGVIISKVDGPRVRGVRAIVVIDHLPLASFLRDAENPSHTEWQHDGSHFRGKYYSGKSDLMFVKRSVYELIRMLTDSERTEDPSLLIDIFSLPADPEDEDAFEAREKKKGKKPGTPPPPPPPAKPRRFRVHRLRGGFSIGPGDPGTSPPSQLDIRVAYDVRRGKALKRYDSADFKIDKKPICLKPEPHNVTVLECSENRILVEIAAADFSLSVVGFDEKRDLYVSAVPKEIEDGGSAS